MDMTWGLTDDSHRQSQVATHSMHATVGDLCNTPVEMSRWVEKQLVLA